MKMIRHIVAEAKEKRWAWYMVAAMLWLVIMMLWIDEAFKKGQLVW